MKNNNDNNDNNIHDNDKALDVFMMRTETMNRSPLSTSSSSYLSYIKSRYASTTTTTTTSSSSSLPKTPLVLTEEEILEWKQNLDLNDSTNTNINTNTTNTNTTSTNTNTNSNIYDEDIMMILPSAQYCGGGIDSPINVMIDNFIVNDDDNSNNDNDDNNDFDRYIPSFSNNNANDDKDNINTQISSSSSSSSPSSLSSLIMKPLKLPLDSILGTKFSNNNNNNNTIRTEADILIQCYIDQLDNNNEYNDDNDNENIEVIINENDNTDNDNEKNNDNDNDNEHDFMPRRVYETLNNNISNSHSHNDDESSNITIVEEFESSSQ